MGRAERTTHLVAPGQRPARQSRILEKADELAASLELIGTKAGRVKVSAN
jgi:hypothetical protein